MTGCTLDSSILVVDDDEIVLEYLSGSLGAAGYEVITATNAQDALVSLQQDLVRIVILDIIMPGMDGLALCRTIRRRTCLHYVYLMLHTSKTTDADVVDGLAAGADDYIAKGSSRQQMIERVRAAQGVLSFKRRL